MTLICASAPPLRMPKPLRKVAANLLDQQLWNFGCDARAADSNRLLMFGFKRHRPARVGDGSSCYVLPLAAGLQQLVVWGFGVYLGTMHEGLFVRRFKFSPAAAFAEQGIVSVFKPNGLRLRTLTQRAGAEQRDRLCLLLHSMSAYERWIIATFGAPYRDDCLRQRSHLKTSAITKSQCVPELWESLARQFATPDAP